MNEFALRQQREARERVGILAARQRPERPHGRVINTDRGAVAARPFELLGPGRDGLSVAPEQAAVGADDQVAILARAAADPVAPSSTVHQRAVIIPRRRTTRPTPRPLGQVRGAYGATGPIAVRGT